LGVFGWSSGWHSGAFGTTGLQANCKTSLHVLSKHTNTHLPRFTAKPTNFIAQHIRALFIARLLAPSLSHPLYPSLSLSFFEEEFLIRVQKF